MLLQGISFFDGLADEEIGPLISRQKRRKFSPGEVVLKEGENPNALYVILSGTANVFVSDRNGQEHQIGQVGPGSTLGEMWLFTRQPASALVRASSELETLVLSDSEFHRIAARFPIIYRNLGAILSERVARTNRRALEDKRSRVTTLTDCGAPPLLGYALACSVAWHTRKPTLLMLFADEMPEELARLSAESGGPQARALEDLKGLTNSAASALNGRASAMLVRPSDGFTPQMVAMAAEDLSRIYEHVLIQLPPGALPATEERSAVGLAGLHDPVPQEERSHARLVLRAWANGVVEERPDALGVLRAPALIFADSESLRKGVLPQESDAGRAIGWAARDIARLKVGLALGAGSVKGYAHIGVWRFMERAGLRFDYLAGTSIGSAVASLCAIGYDTEEAADIMDTIGSAAFRLTLPFSSALSSGGLKKRLKAIGKDVHFEDLKTPLAVVTADIIAGREVVFRRGLVWPAVLASMSIPGIYPAQRVGRYALVDGGVLNPVPSNVVANMGADIVISVKLANRAALSPVEAESGETKARAPTILQAITRSIDMMQSKISTDAAAAATILIEPAFRNIGGFGLRRFSKGRRYIPLGEASAEAAMPRITAAIPWLGRDS